MSDKMIGSIQIDYTMRGSDAEFITLTTERQTLTLKVGSTDPAELQLHALQMRVKAATWAKQAALIEQALVQLTVVQTNEVTA